MIVNCNIFSEEIRNSGAQCVQLFNSCNAIALKAGPYIRYIIPSLNMNKRIKYCNDDTIIVFDGGIKDRNVLEHISKDSMNKRLIFYYWNPVDTSLAIEKIPQKFEIWSYSPEDCEKYGLRYNSTFFFDSLLFEQSEPVTNDILFIGKDKGRYSILMDYREQFETNGFSTDFYVTATHPRIDKSKPKSMDYKSVLLRMQKSNCIFDYYNNPNAGMSLRAMEALFFKKKLITNNILIKEYDFYHPSNILVVNEKLSQIELTDFMKKELEPVPDIVKNQYLFQNWIKRFER